MKWGDYLMQDLRAFVESHYPASPEKGQRGICGISAGGHAAFYQALTHPDLYGAVSVLSGAMELRGYAGAVGLDYWIGPKTADVSSSTSTARAWSWPAKLGPPALRVVPRRRRY